MQRSPFAESAPSCKRYAPAPAEWAYEAVARSHASYLLRQLAETGHGLIHGCVFGGILLQELQQRATQADGRIELGIRAGGVSAEVDEVFRALICGECLPNLDGRLLLLGRGKARCEPAHGLKNVDGRIVAGSAEFSGKNNVAVEDGANCVADRLIEIVAFHEDGEKSSDRAFSESSRALKNLRQKIEDGRRVPFLTGRFSRRKSDFALRHGEPGN